MIVRTPPLRLAAPLALLLSLACKTGTGEESGTQEDGDTDTNTASGEPATVTGVVSDDSAFTPGAPSVPVAGTNFWLSSDAASAAPKVYVLGPDESWIYHADATMSGDTFSVSAPAGAYVMISTTKLAAVLPPPSAGAAVGVVVNRESTIGSVLFQAAIDGEGRRLVEAQQIDYPSIAEVAAVVGAAAKRSGKVPAAALLNGTAELLVEANKDFVGTIVDAGASEEALREAFVDGPSKWLTAENTVDKYNAGTYDARKAALSVVSSLSEFDAPRSSRLTVSAMAAAGRIDTFRAVVREDVYLRAWDSVHTSLASKPAPVQTQAQTAMWSSVRAMTDEELAAATAPGAGALVLDTQTENLVAELKKQRTSEDLTAYLEQFCSSVDCSSASEADGGDDDSGGGQSSGDGDGTSSDAAKPEAPTDVNLSRAGTDLSLTWAYGAAAVGVVIVERDGADPTFQPTDGAVYTVGMIIGDSEVLYVGTANQFLDEGVVEGIQQHYALFAYSSDGLYSLATFATTTLETPIPITGIPAMAVNQGGMLSPGWLNPTNVTANDGAYAVTDLDDTFGTSHELRIYGFDFSALPSSCTIKGIQVRMSRREVAGGSDHAKDNVVRLVRSSTAIGENKASVAPWPVDTPAFAYYGGANDLWGETWTRAQIADMAGFGVIIQATRVAGSGTTHAEIDYVDVIVTYTVP